MDITKFEVDEKKSLKISFLCSKPMESCRSKLLTSNFNFRSISFFSKVLTFSDLSQ